MSQSAHLFLFQRHLSLACLGSREYTERLLERKLVEPSTLPACYKSKEKNSGVQGPGIHKIPGSKCILYEV